MAMHLSISGKVQGVGYRAAFAAQARALHLTGWVRNRQDGTVEAMVAGDAAALAAIQAWAWHGPPGARVIRVSAAEATDTLVSGSAFDVRPTV